MILFVYCSVVALPTPLLLYQHADINANQRGEDGYRSFVRKSPESIYLCVSKEVVSFMKVLVKMTQKLSYVSHIFICVKELV